MSAARGRDCDNVCPVHLSEAARGFLKKLFPKKELVPSNPSTDVDLVNELYQLLRILRYKVQETALMVMGMYEGRCFSLEECGAHFGVGQETARRYLNEALQDIGHPPRMQVLYKFYVGGESASFGGEYESFYLARIDSQRKRGSKRSKGTKSRRSVSKKG
jgi:hypothetical protein